jgi:hypothetical protein
MKVKAFHEDFYSFIPFLMKTIPQKQYNFINMYLEPFHPDTFFFGIQRINL